MSKPKKKPMTVAEAGRLGGNVTGSCKARPAHAQRIALLRWFRVKAKKAEADGDAELAAILQRRVARLSRPTIPRSLPATCDRPGK